MLNTCITCSVITCKLRFQLSPKFTSKYLINISISDGFFARNQPHSRDFNSSFQKSSLLYALPFICNCVLVSPSILTDGGLRIYKNTPDDFEYILESHNVERNSDEADSKERRSNMGSSFIRYGRSDPVGNVEKVFSSDNDGSSKVNRYPRWKSPDIIIRFGRSDFKSLNGDRNYKRGKNYLNFIR